MQSGVRAVAHPGDVSIGSDEDGGRRRYATQSRELPIAVMFGVDRKHTV